MAKKKKLTVFWISRVVCFLCQLSLSRCIVVCDVPLVLGDDQKSQDRQSGLDELLHWTSSLISVNFA